MLGWSQYGDRAITYLFGTKGIRPYQVVFLLFVFWGCIGGGDLVWNLSDISNALMAVPNCIAVLVLSGVIAKGTKYWRAVWKKRTPRRFLRLARSTTPTFSQRSNPRLNALAAEKREHNC